MKISPSKIGDHPIRAVDHHLLAALNNAPQSTVPQLEGALEVTATAIRQRLDRMLESGLVKRQKLVNGRGRPTYSYSLTVLGHRHAGADYGVLADAMWNEILAISDRAIREQLLHGVAQRLGRQFSERLSVDSPVAERMQDLTRLMASKKIPPMVCEQGALPIIDVHVCPYPDLASPDSASPDHHHVMCRLEEEMFSAALGEPVHLSRCRLNGDSCCQFSLGPSTVTMQSNSSAPS